MEWIRSFVKSILAGIMISVGCVVNLSCDNKYIGAILFCIGLITILLFNFNLPRNEIFVNAFLIFLIFVVRL